MKKLKRFSTSNLAVLYLIECTLATIGYQAGLKRRSKNEFRRQINIAQDGIIHIEENPHLYLEQDFPPRIREVINNFKGDVNGWAAAKKIVSK